MTTLSIEDKTKFWLRVYFGSQIESNIILSCIDRAYRDFSRTMHGVDYKDKKTRLYSYGKLRMHMHEIICQILTQDFNQDSFDIWHKESCDKLTTEFNKIINYELFYGQAQKWINMTLKYAFAIGNEEINGIERNYKYFHIPIDNIIQDKLFSYKIVRIPIKWSRINDYSIYIDYQYKVRKIFVGQIPMDVEFRLFNGEAEIKKYAG
jgi:hypothetical protein